MSYIKHILLPHEEILYDGRVHPRILLPGLLLLLHSAIMLMEATDTGGKWSIILPFLYHLSVFFPSTNWLYNSFYHWQEVSPNIAMEVKVIALIIAIWGLYKFIKALMIIQTTELMVTNLRIIAKRGIFEVTTIEMDRNRVAGVVVHSSFLGRIMGYGNIIIQGFTSSIQGLPVMVNPHLVEKFVC